MNDKFIKVPRRLFQTGLGGNDTTIMDELHQAIQTDKDKYKSVTVDKCFYIYAEMMRSKGSFDTSLNTLAHFTDVLYTSRSFRNTNTVRATVSLLEEVGLIEIQSGVDIHELSTSDTFRAKIDMFHRNQDFLMLNEDEYRIMDKLGHRDFFVYATIKNFRIQKEDYSSISLKRMAHIMKMTSGSIMSSIRRLEAVEVMYRVAPAKRYYYSEEMGKMTQPCSRYKTSPNRINDFINLSDDEIDSIVKTNEAEEKAKEKTILANAK